MKTKLHIAALAVLFTATSTATPALAQTREWFDLGWGGVGASSDNRCFQGLCVRVFIQRVNVNGDRNEVCAELENLTSGTWRGGRRLTHFNDYSTFASIDVPAGQKGKICETLPQQSGYWVVLRKDS